MHARPATNATLARVARGSLAVRAMNDGTTASGFTIVISAVNDRTATFHNGMLQVARLLGCSVSGRPGNPVTQQPSNLNIDRGVVLSVDVPKQPTALTAGHLRNDPAVKRDLLAIALQARLATFVVDDGVGPVFANQTI